MMFPQRDRARDHLRFGRNPPSQMKSQKQAPRKTPPLPSPPGPVVKPRLSRKALFGRAGGRVGGNGTDRRDVPGDKGNFSSGDPDHGRQIAKHDRNDPLGGSEEM